MNLPTFLRPRAVSPQSPQPRRTVLLAVCAMPLAMAGCQVPAQGLKPPPQFTNLPGKDPEREAVPFQPPAEALTTKTSTITNFLSFAGSDTVDFAARSAELDASARQVLTRQAEWLAAHPHVTVVIEGHSDERVSVPEAFTLSGQRANAVRQFLAANGVAASRIRLLASGRMLPRTAGHDEAAWQQNRRARTHLILEPFLENRP